MRMKDPVRMPRLTHRLVTYVAVLVVVATFTSHANAQTAGSRDLFIPVAPTKMDLSNKQQAILRNLKEHKSTADIQIVTINTKVLDAAATPVLLNVAKDLRFEASVEKSTGKGATILSGKLKNPLDSAVLINRDGNITGTIRAEGKLFSVKPLGGELHAIIREDESKFPPEHPPEFKKTEEKAASPANLKGVKPQSYNETNGPFVLRILVAYTPEANATVADMNGVIQLAIAKTNQAIECSKINL